MIPGSCIVPVVRIADAETVQMTFSDYMDSCKLPDSENLYLKDWHFQKECNATSVYQPPQFLQTDWVNNEEWTGDINNPFEGDYKFLYFGMPGTWTEFHADVLATHSWSANICGKKLWYLVPKGNEKFFRSGNDYVRDIRTRKDLWEKAGVITFVQESGEIVFIPSNCYHQVHNLEATISLNHNSINSSNVDLVRQFLQQRIEEIYKEIGHLQSIFDEEEMKHYTRMILNADSRLTLEKLNTLLDMVIEDRSRKVASCYVCFRHSDPRLCNSECLSTFKTRCICLDSTCSACLSFLLSFDLSIAIFVKNDMKGF